MLQLLHAQGSIQKTAIGSCRLPKCLTTVTLGDHNVSIATIPSIVVCLQLYAIYSWSLGSVRNSLHWKYKVLNLVVYPVGYDESRLQSTESTDMYSDMLIDFSMTYTTHFQLTLTTTMSTLLFDPEPRILPSA